MSWPITISPPVSMAQRSDANSDIAIALAGLDVTNKSVTVDWSNVDAARPTLVDEVLYELVVRRSAAMVHVLCNGPHVPDTVRRIAENRGIGDRVQVFDGPRPQAETADPLDRPVTAKDVRDMLSTISEAYLKLEEARYSTLANLAGKFDERLVGIETMLGDRLQQINDRLIDIETAVQDARQ